jgi:drug/metabolite transporter (DMT)-like permease
MSADIDSRQSRARTAILTVLAMTAFAANSLLCRMALADGAIDPGAFALIRVASGAVTLAAIAWLTQRPVNWRPDWPAASMLAVYLVFFSFAYVGLTAGTGALILFGAVQLTMFGTALRAGERFPPLAWVGLAAAAAGLVILVAPGVSAPRPWPAAGMALAGIGWGVYSLMGRGAGDPLAATARNFLWATLLVAPVGLFYAGVVTTSGTGVGLALASGVVASGLGYVIWYAALAGLTAGSAATVQLSVPVIAALGGVALLGESLTVRLVLASVISLGGIGLVLARRRTAG